jgi:hypothetical protein
MTYQLLPQSQAVKNRRSPAMLERLSKIHTSKLSGVSAQEIPLDGG